MQDFGKIIQIVPCAATTHAVYATDSSLDVVVPVRYLALTDKGDIYGLVNTDGYHEIADSADNFAGLCEGDIRAYLKENEITDTEGILEVQP